MTPPSRLSSAASDSKPTSPDRKRKRASNSSPAGPPAKQHTLKSLFSGQKRAQVGSSPPSPAHRSARHEDLRSSPVSTSTPPRSLTHRDMYSFPSRSPSAPGGGAIDLTNSSPTSSQPMRMNGSVRGRNGINSQAGAKKLVVKNLKTNTNWDGKAYLESIWDKVNASFGIILNDSDQAFSKEELYRGVENVCRQGGASTLFSRLDATCKSHMEGPVRSYLLERVNGDNVSVLKDVLIQWKRWKKQMETIRAIFFFLDRSYLLSSSKPTLTEYTSQLFRDVIYNHEQLKPKIIDGACDLVSEDRTGNKLEPYLFRQSISMFHELSTYTSSFEARFLGLTQEYVVKWSEEQIANESVPKFVAMTKQLMDKEMTRCDEFELDPSTKRELSTLLDDRLVTEYVTDLTEYEPLASLLDNYAMSDLTALYSLLDRRSLGDKLRPPFEKWIIETGTNIVFAKDEEGMIVHLISLKRRLDTILRDAFQSDESIGHGLRESFGVFMNKTKKSDATWGTDNTKVGEMVAKYLDQLLRGGAKVIPDVLTTRRSSSITAPSAPLPVADDMDVDELDEDAEMNIQLDQALDLFRFVQGKAVFEAFYKKDLARRLLMGRSASADAERSMLARLKTECGENFTKNLEQMFKDVELSREELQSYKERLEDRIDYEKGRDVELGVNILSQGAWPAYPDINVVIPADVKRSLDSFELHYKNKHRGRKMFWKHALAHCQMRANFSMGSKELVVSSFQAVVMLLFNGLSENDHLTYHHIKSESGLPEAEVKRTLQSLACAKLRPLAKHPRGKDINDTDTFSINPSFHHPKYRVKINQVQLKETKEENKETHIRAAEDRGYETQAHIVRIMKSTKRITHANLVSETITATMSRGALNVNDIKKNIERLIEKEYMERDVDTNEYVYLA